MAAISTLPIQAADFSAKVLDGLGRPVPGVSFEVYRPSGEASATNGRVVLAKVVSDSQGNLRGRYEEKSPPAGEPPWVDLNKPGYGAYSSPGLEKQYVLQRVFHPADVAPIAVLTGAAQTAALRELLAGDFDSPKESLSETVFAHEAQLRPGLRALVKDPKVGVSACELLSFIGAPEDIRLIRESPPPAGKDDSGSRWAYALATGLLEPANEEDWLFLTKCATNGYADPMVDAAAIQTLRLNATPRAMKVLQEAYEENPDRNGLIKSAYEYILSRPPLFATRDPAESAKRVAQALGMGEWKGNKPPRFNQEGDKALVDCEFIAGNSLLVYTATFQRASNSYWHLRGVRETVQTLIARAPAARPATPPTAPSAPGR